MYNERLSLYEKYADAVIECDKSTVDSTVEKIVEAVQKITLE